MEEAEGLLCAFWGRVGMVNEVTRNRASVWHIDVCIVYLTEAARHW